MTKSKSIILIATQRSGTNLLTSLLSSLELFVNHSEVFHAKGILDKKNFFNFRLEQIKKNPELSIPSEQNIDFLFDSYINFLENLNPSSYSILDVKYNSTCHFTKFWQSPVRQPYFLSLVKRKSIPVIHLVRTNVLEAYCSGILARRNNKYKRINEELLKFKTTYINPRGLIFEIKQRLQETNFFRYYLDNYQNSCLINYSEILEGNVLSSSVKSKISQLLDIDINNIKMETPLKKVSPPLEEMIENYDEIFDLLKKHKLEYLLNNSIRTTID